MPQMSPFYWVLFWWLLLFIVCFWVSLCWSSGVEHSVRSAYSLNMFWSW